MQDDPPVAEILEIAASAIPLLQRAQALVESVGRWLTVDALWLTVSDPAMNVYATVGSAGLGRAVLDHLEGAAVVRGIHLGELHRNRRPGSVMPLPVPLEELPTWADCLGPTRFRGGLGVPLSEPGGGYVGMLSLLSVSDEPPPAALRRRLAALAPSIARGVSPIGSLKATANLVDGATSGVVLVSDGATYSLPGLESHPLLGRDSDVVNIARQTLLMGQVYRSFLWPTMEGSGGTDHARMTVLAAHDVPSFVLGTLLVTPHAECRGLTPRELEVLGLVVEGRSNQQIARRLSVTLRTVATHVENILHKLDVPTRTLAAVLAEREGCHVPPLPILSAGG